MFYFFNFPEKISDPNMIIILYKVYIFFEIIHSVFINRNSIQLIYLYKSLYHVDQIIIRIDAFCS